MPDRSSDAPCLMRIVTLDACGATRAVEIAPRSVARRIEEMLREVPEAQRDGLARALRELAYAVASTFSLRPGDSKPPWRA